MCMGKQIELIIAIPLPQTCNPAKCIFCPGIQIHSASLILQKTLQNPCKFPVILPVLFITADIFLNHNFIIQGLVWSFQDDLSEIAPFMKLVHRNKIFQSVRISDELLRRQVRMLH